MSAFLHLKMSLSEKEISEFRVLLESSEKPFFMFDDDPDGLCSFLLLYRAVMRGRGLPIKARPALDESFVRKVVDYSPDRVFVLDKPLVTQEFIDEVNRDVVWLDHHPPVKRRKVKYFNPMLNNANDNRPTSYWAYKIVDGDLWVAMTGCVADWHIPDFVGEFRKKHPGLLPENIRKPEDALFKSRIGELARIFSFVLKGKTKEVLQSIKVLTRIKSPEEILDQTTAQGKFIWKRQKRIHDEYREILSGIKVGEDKIAVHIYKANKMSFTSELSNEIIYRHPDKIVIIGREKSGEIKSSIRSSDVKLPPIIEKALKGLNGYGGGHDNACGACVKKEDFPEFLRRMKKEVKKALI
ncbi:DHH family phosphoesterase [Candidatus Woesearchaeota archaeon]|nr:MAG: DHH family phosphoesterase [Candidatus Woesearchaeota archaeon]